VNRWLQKVERRYPAGDQPYMGQFRDVKPGSSLDRASQFLAKQGVLQGVEDPRTGERYLLPNKYVTKGEMVEMMARQKFVQEGLLVAAVKELEQRPGVPGSQGPAGQQGPPGEKGRDGKRGRPGKDAIQPPSPAPPQPVINNFNPIINLGGGGPQYVMPGSAGLHVSYQRPILSDLIAAAGFVAGNAVRRPNQLFISSASGSFSGALSGSTAFGGQGGFVGPISNINENRNTNPINTSATASSPVAVGVGTGSGATNAGAQGNQNVGQSATGGQQ
jgi:hypothetical protein